MFENRVSFELDEINWILDYVGVWIWGDCVKEVNFFGEEIEVEWLENKKNNNNSNVRVEFFSSLMGFICYCRCVILNKRDYYFYCDESELCVYEDLFWGIKVEDFFCLIFLEIMMDFVVIEIGYMYDWSFIMKWFGFGNIMCFKIGKILISIELVNNVFVSYVI